MILTFKEKPLPGEELKINSKTFYILKVNKKNIWASITSIKEALNNKPKNIKFSEYMNIINAKNFDYIIEKEESNLLNNSLKLKIKKINNRVKDKNLHKIKKIELDNRNYIVAQHIKNTFMIICHREYGSFLVEYDVLKDKENIIVKGDRIGTSGDSIYFCSGD